MINFLYPQYLLLIFLSLPALFFYLKRIKLLTKITGNEKHLKRYLFRLKIRSCIFFLAWVNLCFSLSTPLYGKKTIAVKKYGASVMFVIDISNSMMIKDNDISRLSMAKYLADFIIEKYPSYSFGLVLAKGDGIVSIPLTFEHAILQENISNLFPKMMSSSGTNLEMGILKAIHSFNKERDNSNIIILFTDGEETKGNIRATSKKLLENGINLIVIGLGSKEGGEIKIINDKNTEIKRISSLNESLLMQVCQSLGKNGDYIQGDSYTSLNKIFKLLDKCQINSTQTNFKDETISRNFEFSLCALFLFCFGVIIGYENKSF